MDLPTNIEIQWPRVKSYKTLTTCEKNKHPICDLQDEVNKYLSDGWQLHGPMIFANFSESIKDFNFVQVMVKFA